MRIPVGSSTSWRPWRRLWRGWIIVPTGIGVSVLTILQWKRTSKNRLVDSSRIDSFQITCYRAVPFRTLSRAWGWLSSCYIPLSLRCWLYTQYANLFGVNIDEAAYSLDHYSSLCEFFVRPLKDGLRPIAENNPVVSPADGNVVTAGKVTSCSVEQIKGVTYTIHTFLGEPTWRNETSPNLEDSSNLYKSAVDIKKSVTPMYRSPMSMKKMSLWKRSEPLPSDYEMLQLGLSSAVLAKNSSVSYNNWMLGWLIFYFRFCITDLLKNSFYIGFQLIYGMRSTNDKFLNGASFLKSHLNVNMAFLSKQKHGQRSIIDDSSSQALLPLSSQDNWVKSEESLGEVTALCDPYWDEYKKQLLHKEENQLYQLVIYLAPGDYHRFHSPVDWHVKYRRHFQGELLSVNPRIAQWIPELFTLNERAVYVGEWQYGFFSMIAVGATNVGSIRVYSDEDLQTNTRKWRNGLRHRDKHLDLRWSKGEQVGEFRLGSTIVLLFEAPKDFKFNIKPGEKIKVGQGVVNSEAHS